MKSRGEESKEGEQGPVFLYVDGFTLTCYISVVWMGGQKGDHQLNNMVIH